MESSARCESSGGACSGGLRSEREIPFCDGQESALYGWQEYQSNKKMIVIK